MKKFAFLLFWAATAPTQILAFPEMVRHGYPACATCHSSPDGGGVLTEYGRVLSEELLSTWAKEGEGKFLYGAVGFPEWFSMGGDLRFVETYRKAGATPAATDFMYMQGDLEAAARFDKFEAVAALGYRDASPSGFPDSFITRRHYVTYRPTEKISIRGGKFLPAYGIHTPDHVIEIKRFLGWDYTGTEPETYNVEGYYLGEGFEVFATAILGRPDISIPDLEKGAALRGALLFDKSYKLGVSYLFGTNATQSKHVTGPFAILGITSRLVLMLEADLQLLSAAGTKTTGLYTYARLSYEVVRGLHPFITHELGLNDLSATATQSRSIYGVGLQWFPRPHFDFQLIYQLRKIQPGVDVNFGWLMMHAYL